MRLRIITLTLAILLLASFPASASEIVLDETPLAGGAYVYEINRSADGQVYVTDLYGGQVWRIDSATGAYTRFEGLGMPRTPGPTAKATSGTPIGAVTPLDVSAPGPIRSLLPGT